MIPAVPDTIQRGFFEQPFFLLLRTSAVQSWRKLRGVSQQARLLTSVIGAFVVGYLALSFLLFRWGLKFINTFPGLGTLLTERLLFLLFAFLFVLLLFSNLVISYTNFFRNRETQFLTSLPLASQTIFRWKFFESVLLASWAFLFLIAPLLAAYGLTKGVAWHFYFATFVFVSLFIFLPGIIGAWFAVNLARFLDRRLFQVIAMTFVVAGLIAARFWLKQIGRAHV